MWGGMSGWSLLVFVDHLCCNQYIVGRPDGTSDQLRCCHMLPLVNLCCNQSIVGRPAGVSMVCSVAMLPHVASCQMLLPHACVACGLAESLACVCVQYAHLQPLAWNFHGH